MNANVVFAGPSVAGMDADAFHGLVLQPPAACGDIARAVYEGAGAIGLIDGRFETVASTWHKEILWGLAQGVRMFGSSSMGALRAVETCAFGMHGIGCVFRLYRRGVLNDDDEVALLHGPAEAGFPQLTDAMVNIRVTLRDARRAGVLTQDQEARLLSVAKCLFYKERSYETVLEAAGGQDPDIRDAITRLRDWLPDHRRDVKQEDAARLLATIKQVPCERMNLPRQAFQRTIFWDAFVAEQLSTPW